MSPQPTAADTAVNIPAAAYHRPRSWEEALELRSRHPEALPIAGGTDLMVGFNFSDSPTPALLDLSAVGDRRTITVTPDLTEITVGCGVTFTDLLSTRQTIPPALRQAARTVAAPQIRNRATLAGNVATASPAGDSLVPLVAFGAKIALESIHGTRMLGVSDFLLGPKRTAMRPDELISAITMPVADGPQLFAKLGKRNAMAISLAGVAIDIRPSARTVAVALGAVGPTVMRSPASEAFLAGALDFSGGCAPDLELIAEASRLAADDAAPIDDHRGTAAHRRHSVEVIVRRLLTRACAQLHSDRNSSSDQDHDPRSN